MRKITQNAANAFAAHTKWCSGNTMIDAYEVNGVPEVRMYLHGNEIAYMHDGELLVTLAGWPTPTTRERLNGLLQTLGFNETFFQQNHSQFFGSSLIHANQWLKLGV